MSETLMLPKEGDKIGSGLVIGIINTGGSARVYKTWVENLEINRAVKVMHPDADQDVRERFPTEARITSKLIHQNIVQVFNFGEMESGLPYIEMEYISGETLDSVIRQHGALPLPVALAVIVGILEAIHYAHTIQYTLYDRPHRGVLHRDIKPSNIIFSGSIPKLMDFGIARPPAVSLHTIQGNVPGTVPYMAPETCTSGITDFRSDIYQIGLVMYECISGQIAYPQNGIEPLVNAIKTGERKPLNTHGKAAAIVKKCLELDPDKRYQTAAEVLADVRALYHAQNPNTTPEAQIAAFLAGTTPPQTQPTAAPFASLKTILKITAAFFAVGCLAVGIVAYGPNILGAAIQYAATADTQDTSDTQDTQDTDDDGGEITAPPTTPAVGAATNRPQTPQTKQTPKPAPAQTAKQPAASVPADPQTPPPEDAATFLEQANRLLTAGNAAEALALFQRALRTPSTTMTRPEIIKQSLNGSAKCNSILYAQGKATRSAHDAAWRAVANTFPAGSPEHTEALKRLEAQ